MSKDSFESPHTQRIDGRLREMQEVRDETARQGKPVYETVRPWEHPAWALRGLGD